MKPRIQTPKVHVYYIAQQRPAIPLPPRPAMPIRRMLVPGLFLLTLVIGLGGGVWLGWNSHFSAADREPEATNPAVLSAQTTIPLSYDQSDLNIVDSNLLPELIQQNHYEPTAEEINLAERKSKLKKYLASHQSPLASDDKALDTLLKARNMKMILAISFVESNICRKQAYHNCSGIGGSKIKHYGSFSQWVADFDNLLERRYKGLAVEDFIGYYVQPGSQNWVDGVYQILGDLKNKHIE